MIRAWRSWESAGGDMKNAPTSLSKLLPNSMCLVTSLPTPYHAVHHAMIREPSHATACSATLQYVT